MKTQTRNVILAALGGSVLGSGAHVYAQSDPAKREVYFGETHLHTAWSFDAYIFGNTKAGPADAYRYGKGEPIKHALGYDIQITHPLDWMGVTDHSEYVGIIQDANTPGSALSKTELGKKLIVHGREDIQRIYLLLGDTIIDNKPFPELVAPALAGSIWDKNNEIANAANEPGKFTAFNAYEWTSTPNNSNMHRNIFFKDSAHLPKMPFSSFDSQAPEDLWSWMDKQRAAGVELLAISHNANISDGLMFPTEVNFKGRPIDRAWAESRMRNEPLTEMKQIKGGSETHPLLSPNDEFANYEVFSYLLGDPQGRFPRIPGSYVREALMNGLSIQETIGVNPYKTGIVAGSDSHNTGAPYRQDNFFGGHALEDGGLKERMSGHMFAGLDVRLLSPAGLTAIWAEENTRASLFEGMQRKETYATSGPRITLRFFGAWNFEDDLTHRRDWVKTAYEQGVPMGGDLKSKSGDAPKFALWAVKDPTSGNLDRVQIVKGWSKNGQNFEKIYDVVWAGDRSPDYITGKVPPIGSTVDLEKATYENTIGNAELKAVWTDPDFDPSVHAFYYARTLEIPTPRWTTIQAKELGIVPPSNVPATVQERAWSTPIWYSPADADKASDAAVTVASLKSKGVTPMSDAELTSLVVGKNTWVKNTVTGNVFRIVWSKDGNRTLWNVDPGQNYPQRFGNAGQDSYQGLGAEYAIGNGKITESLGNIPISWTAYKSGSKTLMARSDEFGFVNYEIIETPAALSPLPSH